MFIIKIGKLELDEERAKQKGLVQVERKEIHHMIQIKSLSCSLSGHVFLQVQKNTCTHSSRTGSKKGKIKKK